MVAVVPPPDGVAGVPTVHGAESARRPAAECRCRRHGCRTVGRRLAGRRLTIPTLPTALPAATIVAGAGTAAASGCGGCHRVSKRGQVANDGQHVVVCMVPPQQRRLKWRGRRQQDYAVAVRNRR